mmetsp:Transcript_21108/g.19228  ORF Transcript_21108/g.19228 Transcript_21108/m.19228 type:complete len:139 (+) Transcript_21108:26-442(+)
MKILIYLLIALRISICLCYVRNVQTSNLLKISNNFNSIKKINNYQLTTTSISPIKAFGSDIPFIPTLVISTLVIFGLFNIDNKVDLTDVGRANARRKEKQRKLKYGPTPFEKFKSAIGLEEDDDDDDIEIINKGGGCG